MTIGLQPTGQSLSELVLWLAVSRDVIGYINVRLWGGRGPQLEEGESLKEREEKARGSGGGCGVGRVSWWREEVQGWRKVVVMSGGWVCSLFLPWSQCSLCVYKEVIKPQIYHFHVNAVRENSRKEGWGRGLLVSLYSQSFLLCFWRGEKKRFHPVERCHVSACVTDEIIWSERRVREVWWGLGKPVSLGKWTTRVSKKDPLLRQGSKLKLVNIFWVHSIPPRMHSASLFHICLSVFHSCFPTSLLLFHFSLLTFSPFLFSLPHVSLCSSISPHTLSCVCMCLYLSVCACLSVCIPAAVSCALPGHHGNKTIWPLSGLN